MQQIVRVDEVFPDFRSASNTDRCTFQLAPEFGELPIPTIKQSARLAVSGVVMVDERGKFRDLILKAS